MLLRRTAAVLGGVSGLLHLLMLAHGPLLLGLAMALAAIVCLPCAGHLWRGASVRTWAVVGTMNLTMVLLHLVSSAALPVIDGGAAYAVAELDPVHHHSAGGFALPFHQLFHAATVVAAVEVVLCALGLWLAMRSRSKSAGWNEQSGMRESHPCPRESTGMRVARRSSTPI